MKVGLIGAAAAAVILSGCYYPGPYAYYPTVPAGAANVETIPPDSPDAAQSQPVPQPGGAQGQPPVQAQGQAQGQGQPPPGYAAAPGGYYAYPPAYPVYGYPAYPAYGYPAYGYPYGGYYAPSVAFGFSFGGRHH